MKRIGRIPDENIRRENKRPMLSWLDPIPYPLLILAAVFLLVAPVRPMPHVLEKLIMLKNGTLHRPIDIFDLIFHLVPTLLLGLKIVRSLTR
jgi:hypothetical protein